MDRGAEKRGVFPTSSKIQSIPGIAATFIGTVVGAGFASGQEILQFFGIYGWYGWLGIILAVFLLGFAGVKVFHMGAILKPKSYRDFLIYIMGDRLASVMDFLLLFFLVILIGVMFAGCGAIFETMNLNYWAGILATALCLIVVLCRELSGIIRINLIIVPLMFAGAIFVTVFSLKIGEIKPVTDGNAFHWILAALQFSAYNLVLAIPVLLSLGKKYPARPILQAGGWAGSIGLGVMAGLIQWAILVNFYTIQNCDLPMAVLAKFAGVWVYWGYAVVLWGEMFSTLLANTYGVAQRMAVVTGWPFRVWVFILTTGGIVIGQIGFVNLIARGYPLFGWICLIILILLMGKPLPSLSFSGNKRYK
jgi:uncharacterized membrane protein YkvI